MNPSTSRLRRAAGSRGRSLGLSLLGVPLLAAPALPTWSVVAADQATGEVCVAGATCIADIHLTGRIGIIVVGKGAAAGQSLSNPQVNFLLGQYLDQGLSPQEALDELQATVSMTSRQFGIVTLDDDAVTFNGPGVGLARPTVTGSVGTIRYAIQGNVLAGDAVVLEAEQTFRTAGGDLGQRVMAAMQRAREMGGDGRCSCSIGNPTGCGAPPPSFTHSAYTSFILLARIGDRDGTTNYHSGSYYLNKRYVGNAQDIDPVIGLQERYDFFRRNHIGVTDGILSEVEPAALRMPADGTSTIDVTVRLRDINDNRLAFSGFPLHVRGIGGPQPASVDSVVDHLDGTYTVKLRAGTTPGHCRWRIVVMHDGKPRTFHPPLEIDVDPLAPLHVGLEEVSASAGAAVPLVTNAGLAAAGRPYQVLASASGTNPGTPFMGGTLPLNSDRVLRFTMMHPGPPRLAGSAGQLDAFGRAETTLTASPEMLAPFVGGRFDFSTVLFGSPVEFTDPVGFDILP